MEGCSMCVVGAGRFRVGDRSLLQKSLSLQHSHTSVSVLKLPEQCKGLRRISRHLVTRNIVPFGSGLTLVVQTPVPSRAVQVQPLLRQSLSQNWSLQSHSSAVSMYACTCVHAYLCVQYVNKIFWG